MVEVVEAIGTLNREKRRKIITIMVIIIVIRIIISMIITKMITIIMTTIIISTTTNMLLRRKTNTVRYHPLRQAVAHQNINTMVTGIVIVYRPSPLGRSRQMVLSTLNHPIGHPPTTPPLLIPHHRLNHRKLLEIFSYHLSQRSSHPPILPKTTVPLLHYLCDQLPLHLIIHTHTHTHTHSHHLLRILLITKVVYNEGNLRNEGIHSEDCRPFIVLPMLPGYWSILV